MKSLKKRNVHLICNAHLDPVWLWEWQEGAAEAMSTFRVAAELCEKDEAFIFNHNEVILYQWIQEYEPALFERIRKLVKAGKWHIMGGWYVQPDCNMPSGESFVRQILQGKSYFKEHFGVKPTTAINFDPFGHTRGLVQIMAKSGYDSYLFGRPEPQYLKLPAGDFIWVGYDGSQVMATRFAGWYNSPLGKAAETITARIKDNPNQKVLAILWGVGNHGGGPSRIDLREVNRLIRQTGDSNIIHSTPERYYKELSRFGGHLPEYAKNLNPWGIGCYTSMIRVKQQHRQLENELYMTEKMASAAACAGLMKYPAAELGQAQTDLLFAEFHDILPGSSVQPAEDSALRTMSHGLEILSKIKARAFFAMASGQPKPIGGRIPILVYNPHPFKVKQTVECEFNLPDFNNSGTFTLVNVCGKAQTLPSQVEQENSNLIGDWRKRVVFVAELEPSCVNRFDCVLKVVPKKPVPILKAKGNRIVFKTKELEVIINTKTGFIDRYKAKGVDYLGKNSFMPLVMADNEDPWEMKAVGFNKIAGRFRLMSREAGAKFSGLKKLRPDCVRVIEDGPVRSVIEAVLSFEESFICQRYTLPKFGTEIEVETHVHWNQKNQMLKLSVPTLGRDSRYIGQVAYGVAELPSDGKEAVSQKWSAVVSRKDNMALTCINDGIYGSDFSDKGLRLTLLRSPMYSGLSTEDPNVVERPRYTPRIDQGERLFRFWFNAAAVKKRFEAIDREALTKNEKPFALSFFPSGNGKQAKSFAVLSDDIVQITAIKKAQKGDDYIIRLFEPTGKPRTTVLSLPQLKKKIKLSLGGFEIKTLRINPKTGRYVETDLLERKQ
jgi:alpha-mannosidase